jgi:hypothetical protein
VDNRWASTATIRNIGANAPRAKTARDEGKRRRTRTRIRHVAMKHNSGVSGSRPNPKKSSAKSPIGIRGRNVSE